MMTMWTVEGSVSRRDPTNRFIRFSQVLLTVYPLPTFVLRDCIDISLPNLMAMVNVKEVYRSHRKKSPLWHRYWKKRHLIRMIWRIIYRPMSNPSFVSKLAKIRVVTRQLMDNLTAYHLVPNLQSAYRRHHSSETAMLQVLSDVLLAADSQKVTLLPLLYFSAAFDCIDHDILLHTL